MTIEQLADIVKHCSKDELKEIEREIRVAWARDEKSINECFDMVACILQNRNFEANL
jgi:hypothetical protein